MQIAKNQDWSKSSSTRGGDRDSKSEPNQALRHSMMAGSFNLPLKDLRVNAASSSSMDDGEVEVINSRIPLQSLLHLPFKPAVPDRGVAVSAALPTSLQMTPLSVPCPPSSPCSEFDFYSQTETDNEDSFLDLSSSPGKSSEGSDDGTEGDSPISQTEHSTTRGGSSDVPFVGGIAECGSGSEQAVSADTAMMSRKAPSSSRLPPTRSTSTSSSLLPQQLIAGDRSNSVAATGQRPLGDKTIGCSRDVKAFSRIAPASALSGADAMCHRAGPLDCSPHRPASNRASFGNTHTPSNAFVNRDKENIVNVSTDSNAKMGEILDLSGKCVPMSECEAQPSKATSGTPADSCSWRNSSAVQGVKRKQYDTVAIVSDSKGGKNKRPKSTMRVASIMSFFTPS